MEFRFDNLNTDWEWKRLGERFMRARFGTVLHFTDPARQDSHPMIPDPFPASDFDAWAAQYDQDVTDELTRLIKKKGIEVVTSAKVTEVVDKGDKLEIKIEGKESVIADKALLAIGRVPDLEALGEVKFETERGRIWLCSMER